MEKLIEANKALHYINGTKLEALTQRISKNNTSGTKGVNKHTINRENILESRYTTSEKKNM